MAARLLTKGWKITPWPAAAAASCNIIRKFSSRRSSSSVAESIVNYQSLSSPLLMLPSEQNGRLLNFRFYTPLENKIVKLENCKLPEEIFNSHYVASTNGLLACVNRDNYSFYLTDILSSPTQIFELPPIESLPTVERVVRTSPSVVHTIKLHGNDDRYLYDDVIKKVAVSCVPNEKDDCFVMIIHSTTHDLAFCRIGDECWIKLDNPRKVRFGDVLYSKKKKIFYAISKLQNKAIVAWDINNPSSPKFAFDGEMRYIEVTPLKDIVSYNINNRFLKMVFGGARRTSELDKKEIDQKELDKESVAKISFSSQHLVETPQGDILQVVRYTMCIGVDKNYDPRSVLRIPYRTAWFQVFKLDFETQTAQQLESLGDTVLFVDWNESFSVSARDHLELKPNSIYFADDDERYIFNDYFSFGGHDMGVYNMNDHSITPLYQHFGFDKILPPPVWLSSRSYQKGHAGPADERPLEWLHGMF